MEALYSSEISVDFNGLHSVVSQKIVLFITTAVRTSNPTCLKIGTNTSISAKPLITKPGVPSATADLDSLGRLRDLKTSKAEIGVKY
jgi:hypothetical protein